MPTVIAMPGAKTPVENLIAQVKTMHEAYTAACRALDNICADVVPDQYEAPVTRRTFPHMASESGLTLDGLAIHFNRELKPAEAARIPVELPLILNNQCYGMAPVMIGKHDPRAAR